MIDEPETAFKLMRLGYRLIDVDNDSIFYAKKVGACLKYFTEDMWGEKPIPKSRLTTEVPLGQFYPGGQ